jgi:hypothetical protein
MQAPTVSGATRMSSRKDQRSYVFPALALGCGAVAFPSSTGAGAEPGGGLIPRTIRFPRKICT